MIPERLMGLGARRITVAATVAVLTVASVGLLAWQRLAEPAVVTGGTATVDGVTAEIRQAGWVEFDMGHVMDGQGGFMMPDQMMPDAPSGDQVRLGITLTLFNTSDATREFNLAGEFSLTGGRTPEPQPISADSIGELPRLAAGAALDGTLYFDLEVPADDDPPLYLRWTRDGSTVLIEVPLSGDAPVHEHG
jgi:hypothetical protein